METEKSSAEGFTENTMKKMSTPTTLTIVRVHTALENITVEPPSLTIREQAPEQLNAAIKAIAERRESRPGDESINAGWQSGAVSLLRLKYPPPHEHKKDRG